MQDISRDSNVQAWQDLTPEEKQTIEKESSKLNMLTKTAVMNNMRPLNIKI